MYQGKYSKFLYETIFQAKKNVKRKEIWRFLLSIFEKLWYDHPFNLHPEKWFEGYPIKSTPIFIECTLIFLGCHHALIFLGYSLDFFLIYKYETQFFFKLPPKLYIPSTLNIDLILWHTQSILCALKC